MKFERTLSLMEKQKVCKLTYLLQELVYFNKTEWNLSKKGIIQRKDRLETRKQFLQPRQIGLVYMFKTFLSTDPFALRTSVCRQNFLRRFRTLKTTPTKTMQTVRHPPTTMRLSMDATTAVVTASEDLDSIESIDWTWTTGHVPGTNK